MPVSVYAPTYTPYIGVRRKGTRVDKDQKGFSRDSIFQKQEGKRVASSEERMLDAEIKLMDLFSRKKGKRVDTTNKYAVLTKVKDLARKIITSMSNNAPKEQDIALAQSLEDSTIEIDMDKNAQIIEMLKEGRYEDFRNSEFAHIPLEELEDLYDFREYPLLNERNINDNDIQDYIQEKRIPGRAAGKKLNESITLNYLRQHNNINVKKFIECMNNEDFTTVFPDSARYLLEWVNYKDGREACFYDTSDIAHNWNLENLRVELLAAYSNPYASKGHKEKILIFPNGEKCKLKDFLEPQPAKLHSKKIKE